MREDNRGWTFSLDEALLWIIDSYCSLDRSNGLKFKHLNNGFVSVDYLWIIVMIL